MKTFNNVKEWVIIFSGAITLIAGIVLVFISIYMPPTGELHSSILAALGEFLTFAGSCLGIASYTAIKIHEINNLNTAEN